MSLRYEPEISTARDLLYAYCHANDTVAAAERALATARSEAAALAGRVLSFLGGLPPGEAIEAYGTAYWVTSGGGLRSIRVKGGWDIPLEPEVPEADSEAPTSIDLVTA